MQGPRSLIIGHLSGIENLPPDSILLGSDLGITPRSTGQNILVGNKVTLSGGGSSVILASPSSPTRTKALSSVCIGEMVDKSTRTISIINTDERGYTNNFNDSVILGRIECHKDRPSRTINKSVLLNSGVMCNSTSSVCIGYKNFEDDITGSVLLGRMEGGPYTNVVAIGNDARITREDCTIISCRPLKGRYPGGANAYLILSTNPFYSKYSMNIGTIEVLDTNVLCTSLGNASCRFRAVDPNTMVQSGIMLKEDDSLIQIGNLNKLKTSLYTKDAIMIGNLVPFTLNSSIAIVHPLSKSRFINALHATLPVDRSIIISSMLTPVHAARDSILIGHNFRADTTITDSILIGNSITCTIPINNCICIGNNNTPRSDSIILGKGNSSLATGLVFNTAFTPRKWKRPTSSTIRLEMHFNPKLEWQCGGHDGRYSNEVPDYPACEGRVAPGLTSMINATYSHKRTVKLKSRSDLSGFDSHPVVQVGAPTHYSTWLKDIEDTYDVTFEKTHVDDITSQFTPPTRPGAVSTGPLYYREEHYIKKTIKLLPVNINGKKYYIPIVYRVLTELLVVRHPSREGRGHRGAEQTQFPESDDSLTSYRIKDLVGAAAGTYIPFTRGDGNKLHVFRGSSHEPKVELQTLRFPVDDANIRMITARGNGITVLPTEARVSF